MMPLGTATRTMTFRIKMLHMRTPAFCGTVTLFTPMRRTPMRILTGMI